MNDFSTVERLINRYSADYEGRLGQAKLLSSQLKEAKQEVENLKLRIENLSKISALLSSYADDRQFEIQHKFESIVTQGLRQIFGEDLSLRIDNRMVGRRFESDFILVSHVGDQKLETSILDARGGGVAAVAGFLLQVVLVLLSPTVRPILFLDEVFSQVSENFLPGLSSFIKELTEQSDLQIVLVTHSNVFGEDADKVYRFSQHSGITTSIVEGG